VRGKKDICWIWAAALLARGHSVTMVAQQLGISRTTLWKALKESAELRRMVAAEQAEMAIEAGAPLHALRNDVRDLIREKLREGDTRVLLWLANKLGIVSANYLDDKQVTAAQPRPIDGEDETLARLAEDEWEPWEADRERREEMARKDWRQPIDPDAMAEHHFGQGETDIMRAYREKAEKEENERRIKEHDKYYRDVERGLIR
jgi:hypothetical protein